MTAGECIRLCARAGPTVGDSWSVLARKLCAAPTAPASVARQPSIVEPCCACDEAKYEVCAAVVKTRQFSGCKYKLITLRASSLQVSVLNIKSTRCSLLT